ncbi:hypothetical protein [Bacillus amyloliquefaciens]|uniref:hypothetical protein n=1 Tax=Bacillus amyloliquefaciens TaxID=1390 RepID=UPI000E282826|nr:hypothetical protein [Bacillus amyloliquefaciens]RDY83138.1 hypothetical protein C3733_19965 [Bacillus amyloliquefaciens]
MSTMINPGFKRYIMFGYSYYPKGGINDVIFEFETIDELKTKVDDHLEHFLQDTLYILDLQERRCIWEGSRGLTKYDLERLEKEMEKISAPVPPERNSARVFDSRNNATLFVGTEWECMEFTLKNYPHKQFPHVSVDIKDESYEKEFNDFSRFINDINLFEISGFNNKICNENGVEIACANSPEHAEGLVKSHNDFISSILLLEEIKNLTDNPIIKDKIEKHLTNCIG